MWIIKGGSLDGRAERLKRSESGDEIILEVPEGMANDPAEILRKIMTEAG